IPTSQTFSQMSPVQKKELIQKIKPDLFVGDGTNDLLAMQEAPLSIAMGNASIEAQKASQIIMMHNNLSALDDLFELSKNIMILLRRNLTIAVTYNILAAAAALSGIIGPFEAAVLMPLSSTLLLLSTYFKTKWLRSLETGQTKIIPSSTPPAFNAIKEH
ncbi:MAG: HAD hydrolase family protein, partial [Bdellovibrionaceae bacterium]|nr:HAD hydrolase family protein [Pseudobdellovibrionaceae bacterium]MDW8190196.1 HAD hydrolase family protein [Pseudobdellovibrionaceae bacterium]